MKIILHDLRKWHYKLVVHTSKFLLDETPELKTFLNQTNEEIILSDDDFRASSNLMVQKLFDLVIHLEEIKEEIELLYPPKKFKKEDDDLPF